MPDSATIGQPQQLAPLPPVSRQHLDELSDQIGIMQHAIGSQPDPAHGYCVDDVARALQVDLLHGRELGWAPVAERAWTNLRFLSTAFDAEIGGFRNFRRVDGSWLPGPSSDDSQARAMLALGETIAAASDPRMVTFATALFDQALPEAQRLPALRAQASVMLACDAVMRVAPTGETARAYRLLAGRIRAIVGSRSGAAWPWPESVLTYENALPVRALIVAGQYLDAQPVIDAGLAILDWQIAAQTTDTGHLSLIGNGWWPQDGEKSKFDQQPIEATCLLLAAESAFEVSGFDRYRGVMEQAYGWFRGENDLGMAVADPARGACGDGLTPGGINTNEGAESTLMWLIALEHIRAMREGRALPPPVAERRDGSASAGASPSVERRAMAGIA